MAESKSHQRAKASAAGKHGQTEVQLHYGRRLDSITSGGGRATEVERRGAPARLRAAAERLDDSGATQRVLQVPQHHKDQGTRPRPDQGHDSANLRRRRARRPPLRSAPR